MVIKFIILLFMSFCFTQETHTFTTDEVDNIFSHIQELEIKDSLNTNTISLQKDVIFKLVEKSENQQYQIENFQEVLDNKNIELGFKEDIIKEQKKEIQKQKLLKLAGFTTSIILPILTLIALL